MVTTCQLCGRAIMANTGVIAHHGYKRPGEGWQTSSCRGARELPYEVSCDCLKLEIPMMENALANVQASLALMIAEPPATYPQYRRFAGIISFHDPIIHARSADFDAAKAIAYGSYNPNCYQGRFMSAYHALKRDERGIADYLKFLRARLAAWVAPKVEA